jgi:hypothetical protein
MPDYFYIDETEHMTRTTASGRGDDYPGTETDKSQLNTAGFK